MSDDIQEMLLTVLLSTSSASILRYNRFSVAQMRHAYSTTQQQIAIMGRHHAGNKKTA